MEDSRNFLRMGSFKRCVEVRGEDERKKEAEHRHDILYTVRVGHGYQQHFILTSHAVSYYCCPTSIETTAGTIHLPEQ